MSNSGGYNPRLRQVHVWVVEDGNLTRKFLQKDMSDRNIHSGLAAVVEEKDGKTVSRVLPIAPGPPTPMKPATKSARQCRRNKRITKKQRMMKRIHFEAEKLTAENKSSYCEELEKLKAEYKKELKEKKNTKEKPVINDVNESIVDFFRCFLCTQYILPHPFSCGNKHHTCLKCYEMIEDKKLANHSDISA